MSKFLLLRNNKQTGPHSVEELKELSLKPYDLIWVDGKSAAWRYPGEIDELKSFAPPVEEQPYDRFYKKNADSAQKKPEPAKAESRIESSFADNTQLTGSSNLNGTANQPSVDPVKKEKEYKRVFVTMPSSGNKNEYPAKEPTKTTPQPIFENIETKASPPAQKASPEKIALVKLSEKEQGIEELYFPKKNSGNTRRALTIAGLGLAVVALIAMGVFIGTSLSKSPQKDTGKQETEKVYRVPQNNSTASELSINQQDAKENIVTGEAIDSSLLTSVTKPKPPVLPKKNTSAENQNKIAAKPLDTNLVLDAEPEKKINVEKKLPKPAPNLASFVSVTNNDFMVGPFGGINKLELTVKNTSEYSLNVVVVELEYLKVNKEVYKTEILYFKDIEPRSTMTVKAPKSSRGNKINYKITLISSKEQLFSSAN